MHARNSNRFVIALVGLMTVALLNASSGLASVARAIPFDEKVDQCAEQSVTVKADAAT